MTPFGRWYFLNSTETSSLGLNILACGHQTYPGIKRTLVLNRVMDSYVLVYLIKGNGYFQSRSI